MPRLFGVADYGNNEGAGSLSGTIARNLSAAAGPGSEAETFESGNALLGLVSGRQPFQGGILESEDKSCSLAYAGFIPAIREHCSAHRLPGGAETGEIILFLYNKLGDQFLREIPGMFSIAVHDRNRKRLLIAGDRSGAFPLYYCNEGGRFIFASSLNAVRNQCGSPDLRSASVVEHLLFDALYGRYTFYEGIYLTEFGGYLTINLESGEATRNKYFSYEELFDIGLYRSRRHINAPEELTARARNCLGRIAEGADRSSFGLSCGGGIDCSYLGGVLNDIGFPLPVLCTSVSDAKVQEDSMARDTADRLGAELYTSYLRSEDFYPLLLRSILDFGQPIVHPATPKFYAGHDSELSLSRPHHIMGVASDLLFGGYGNVRSFYKYLRVRQLFRILPKRLRTVFRIGNEGLSEIQLQLRMRNSLAGIEGMGMGNMERGADQSRVREALSPIVDDKERAVKILMLQNLFDYQQHLLNRRYEISARCGISLYYPFLDLEMVRFAVNLPVSHCVNWREAKIVVRRAALPYLGQGLAARAKYGGDVPVNKWILPMAPLLENGFVRDILSYDPETLSGQVSSSPKLLWNLIDIELWGRLCLRGEDPDRILHELRGFGINCSSFNETG